jgi:hypothetical protein
MAFDLTQYEPVAERLDRWLKKSEQFNPRVLTYMESIPGADVCVIKAELWLGDTRIATGYAEETRGSNRINQINHVEVCETSAIGRALANAGYAGSDASKRPSREEMAKVNRGAPAPRTNKVTDIFPDAQEITGGDVTVKGNQHGELPNWCLAECAKKGYTLIYDNRDKLSPEKNRPWFKDVDSNEPIWAPRNTPLPVIIAPIVEWEIEEEPF